MDEEESRDGPTLHLPGWTETPPPVCAQTCFQGSSVKPVCGHKTLYLLASLPHFPGGQHRELPAGAQAAWVQGKAQALPGEGRSLPPGTGALTQTHLLLFLLAVIAPKPELDRDRGREEFFSEGQGKRDK